MSTTNLQIAYVPIGVGTFHMETAGKEFQISVRLLRELIPENLVLPEQILLSTQQLSEYLAPLHPDLVILQNLTFANGAYTAELLHRFPGCPVILWTPKEPAADGGRLKLNALTGAFAAANRMHTMGASYTCVFGSAGEETVQKALRERLQAVRTIYQLRNLKIASVGTAPEGFEFGSVTDPELRKTFGVRLVETEARTLMNLARQIPEELCREELRNVQGVLKGLERQPDQNVIDFVRLLIAYRKYTKENGIGALASRCWPDFFTEYGTPVCAVLSVLNAEGVVCSCEGDVYGALSMYLAAQLSGRAVFFGDPVAFNEEENSITFWHCGMAPCNLARNDTGACVGVHPNRKIGPTMEFGCEPAERGTILRVGKDQNGNARIFAASGEILDKPGQYLGTSLVFGTDRNARKLIEYAVSDGWEPHFAIAYGDLLAPLKVLAHYLKITIDIIN